MQDIKVPGQLNIQTLFTLPVLGALLSGINRSLSSVEPHPGADQIKDQIKVRSRQEARYVPTCDKWHSNYRQKQTHKTHLPKTSITSPQPPCVSKHTGCRTVIQPRKIHERRHPTSQFLLLLFRPLSFFLFLSVFVANPSGERPVPRDSQTTAGLHRPGTKGYTSF